MLLTDFLSERREILTDVKDKLEAMRWYATPTASHPSLVRITIKGGSSDRRSTALSLVDDDYYLSHRRQLTLQFFTDAIGGNHKDYTDDVATLTEIASLTKLYHFDKAAELMAKVKQILKKTAADYQLTAYNRDILADTIKTEWDRLILMSRRLQE